jgi:predicted transcriptional regulator
MKVLRVGIASYQEMKARTLAIAQGRYRRAADEPKMWFPSAESFARVLSSRNRKMLQIITEEAPQSLKELADLTGRRKSNLSRTLKTMEHYGLVKLTRGTRAAVVPTVLYQRIALIMPLSGTDRTRSAA